MSVNKQNVINLYFNSDGTLQKQSTTRLYPHGHYQTIIHVHFKKTNPENQHTISFQIEDFPSTSEKPMYYLGRTKHNSTFYDTFEFIVPSEVSYHFSDVRSVLMKIQIIERTTPELLGLFETFQDLPEEPSENSYAYVFEDGKLYKYENGDWQKHSYIEYHNINYSYDLVSISVEKGLRIEKEKLDISETETDMLLKYLARIQGQIGDTENIYHAIKDISYDKLNQDFIFEKFSGEEIKINLQDFKRIGQNTFVSKEKPTQIEENDLWFDTN